MSYASPALRQSSSSSPYMRGSNSCGHVWRRVHWDMWSNPVSPLTSFPQFPTHWLDGGSYLRRCLADARRLDASYAAAMDLTGRCGARFVFNEWHRTPTSHTRKHLGSRSPYKYECHVHAVICRYDCRECEALLRCSPAQAARYEVASEKADGYKCRPPLLNADYLVAGLPESLPNCPHSEGGASAEDAKQS